MKNSVITSPDSSNMILSSKKRGIDDDDNESTIPASKVSVVVMFIYQQIF